LQVFAIINWAAALLVYIVVEETAGQSLEALHGVKGGSRGGGGSAEGGEESGRLLAPAPSVIRPLWP